MGEECRSRGGGVGVWGEGVGMWGEGVGGKECGGMGMWGRGVWEEVWGDGTRSKPSRCLHQALY